MDEPQCLSKMQRTVPYRPDSRGFGCREAVVVVALTLIFACQSSPADHQEGEEVEPVSNALSLYGNRWPGGVVPVCFDADSTSRMDFAEKAALIRFGANSSWPTAARISFIGWTPCASNTNGKLVVNINDGDGGAAHIGYRGSGSPTNMYLGFGTGFVPEEQFVFGQIPHEFGHALGFGHERHRPDFDPNLECDGPDQQPISTLGTPPDAESIMAWGVDECHTEATGLTQFDREGASIAYGRQRQAFNSSTQWSTWILGYDDLYADVTGDGRADLVGRNGSAGTDIHVGASTGSSFNSSTLWTTWSDQFDHKFADVDGDGKADIIGRGGYAIHVGLSTGSSFAPSTLWTSWDSNFDHQYADVNADGRSDLIGRNGTNIQVALSTGSGFAGSTQWTTWNTNYDHQLADVNGDGRADLIGRSGSDIQVSLSTGSGFAPSSSWTTWSTSYDHQFADVNGDGRADLVGRFGNEIDVGLSTGSGFAASEIWTTWSTAYDHKFRDANGDGAADIIGRWSNIIHVGLAGPHP